MPDLTFVIPISPKHVQLAERAIQSRTCNVCGQEFPRTIEFWHKNPVEKDGLSRTCKECAKARARQRYRDNPARQIAQTKIWGIAHPDKVAESKRKYTAAHREEERVRAKKVRTEQPEARRATQERYRLSHREAIKAHSHIRRVSTGQFTADDLKRQIKVQNGKCWWCSKMLQEKYHVDHIIPIVKGGTNAPENICVSCPECNLSKGIKLPYEWIGRLF